MILAQNFHGILRQMSTTDQSRHPYFSSYMCVLSFCHQSEYQRGVSAWNFDIEDLKAQASLVSNRSIFKIFHIGILFFRKHCYLVLSIIAFILNYFNNFVGA